jgi:hypothetical protein
MTNTMLNIGKVMKYNLIIQHRYNNSKIQLENRKEQRQIDTPYTNIYGHPLFLAQKLIMWWDWNMLDGPNPPLLVKVMELVWVQCRPSHISVWTALWRNLSHNLEITCRIFHSFVWSRILVKGSLENRKRTHSSPISSWFAI